MARLTPLLIALLVAATIASKARAEEEEDESTAEGGGDDDDDDDDDKGVAGVTLRTHFTGQEKDSAQPKVYAGKEAETLIWFDVEKDASSQKMEFVRAHIEAVSQPGLILQNMTGQLYNRTIEAGEAATLVYKFTPAKEIEPRDYTLVIQCWFHEGEDEAERTTMSAYNGTVTILDSTSAVDFQMFFMVIVLGGICFALYKLGTRGKKSRGGGSASAATSTREKSVGKPAGDDDGIVGKNAVDTDFIPKEHLQARKRSASGSGRKSPKK